ncbi:aminotransferase class I/II-fold pyridoxal phosphate-dependent enzyme [Longimicrobium sp.]|uniref:trans-sulfuration enzyme family protein n=1 Tax=Longimicrobium sp. TaxID=2029185 RepID=UPI002E2F92AC|nr:aminotransferase class I/II-fold pyridoxal phosphate-dependent enzyme [Longimicrobium sp.]HEX6037080.1 aminotransferase class I/II-fold pyridoxal phosphate-dependent enzyme [Longimicrobium sp.]
MQSPYNGTSTRAIHAGDPAPHLGAPVVMPLVPSTTFYGDPSGQGDVLYTRYGNGPNQRVVEERLAVLDGADDAVLVASGMAAMACALLSVLRAGDHVVATTDIYGGTRALLTDELSRLGIETTFVDFFSAGWTDALRPNTRVVLGETPSNPVLRVLDLRPIADAAHAHGAAVIVDATFGSPVNYRALEHGADIVMHSATKYLGGHSDVTAGVLCGSSAYIAEVRKRARIWGPVLDPHGVWLLERGIKTLALRMERHNRNGLEVARWAESRPEVARVFYPGLPSHPDHETATRVLDGFGGMVGIELAGGDEAATRFVRALRLAKYATSLGGVETLISEPRFTSHAAMTPEQRAAGGIRDGFIRVSLGIEDAADIIADFDQALRAAGGAEDTQREAAD